MIKKYSAIPFDWIFKKSPLIFKESPLTIQLSSSVIFHDSLLKHTIIFIINFIEIPLLPLLSFNIEAYSHFSHSFSFLTYHSLIIYVAQLESEIDKSPIIILTNIKSQMSQNSFQQMRQKFAK